MAPLVAFFCCFFLLMMVPVALFLLTFIYRWSCALCGLRKPTVLVASGIMFVAWLSPEPTSVLRLSRSNRSHVGQRATGQNRRAAHHADAFDY